jgi:hypothetical protein
MMPRLETHVRYGISNCNWHHSVSVTAAGPSITVTPMMMKGHQRGGVTDATIAVNQTE